MWRERENAGSAELHGIVDGYFWRQTDLDAGKQVRKRHGFFSRSIDLKVDVSSPDAVAIAVLNRADAMPVGSSLR